MYRSPLTNLPLNAAERQLVKNMAIAKQLASLGLPLDVDSAGVGQPHKRARTDEANPFEELARCIMRSSPRQ